MNVILYDHRSTNLVCICVVVNFISSTCSDQEEKQSSHLILVNVTIGCINTLLIGEENVCAKICDTILESKTIPHMKQNIHCTVQFMIQTEKNIN